MRILLVVASILIIGGEVAIGQHVIVDTFYIDRVLKTPAHPYYGQGSEYGLTTNGVEGATWHLIRDSLYAINYGDLESWFIPRLATLPRGLSIDRVNGYLYDDQTQNDIWIYQIGDWAPDTLYYINGEDRYGGGMILISDSATSAVDESVSSGANGNIASEIYPNPLTSEGTIRITVGHSVRVRVEIYDVLGRTIQTLSRQSLVTGANRVALSMEGFVAGTYFYRILDEENHVLDARTFQFR